MVLPNDEEATANRDKVDAFLAELEPLLRKHNVCIAATDYSVNYESYPLLVVEHFGTGDYQRVVAPNEELRGDKLNNNNPV